MSNYDEFSARRRSRRHRRRSGELDDQWAAADENDIYDDGVEIEDLAVSYAWDDEENPRHREDQLAGRREPEEDADASTGPYDTGSGPRADLGPLPDSARRLRSRPRPPGLDARRNRYERVAAYGDSPSFQKSRENMVERVISGLGFSDPYHPPDVRKPKRGEELAPSLLGNIPFWGFVILTILGFAAVVAVLLACLSVLVLFGN